MRKKKRAYNQLRSEEILALSSPPPADQLADWGRARLDGEWIYWAGSPPGRSALKRVPSTLYIEFAELDDASDKEIAAFASKWGPLGKHKEGFEMVSRWRKLIQVANNLIFGRRALSGGVQLSRSQWRELEDWAFKARGFFSYGDRLGIRVMISASLNRCYAQEEISHSLVTLVDGKLQVQAGSHGLLGIIVTQLAYAITKGQAMVVCHECGRDFRPKRLGARGQRRYCERSGCRMAARRDASRDYRKRQKEAIEQ